MAATDAGGFAHFIEAAKNGELGVAVNPDGFVKVIQETRNFKEGVQGLQRKAYRLAEQAYYGLGEDHPRLTSAQALVAAYRAKAQESVQILQQYQDGLDEVEQMYTAMLRNYRATDEENQGRLQAALRELDL